MSRRPIAVPIAILLALFLTITPKTSRADDKLQTARILFNAGVRAYAAGRYGDAVHAFREAHALTPGRATVLFSLAQAERRQFTVTQDAVMLGVAIEHFRKYLSLVTEGGRRADAVTALGELDAVAASLGKSTTEMAAPQARILITTETRDAIIRIDGKPRTVIPVIEAIAPGKHHIEVSAPGFLGEKRDIVAIEGAILPIEINLREKPSSLAIVATPGASITVDGRSYGRAPLELPIGLPSGEHVVTVMKRGYDSRSLRVKIASGESSKAGLALELSTQRRISYGLFVGALAATVSGSLFTVAAVASEHEARDILARTSRENIDSSALEQYESARKSRDSSRIGAVTSFTLSTALGAAALAAYSFEEPTLPSTGGPQASSAMFVPLRGGAWLGVGGRF